MNDSRQPELEILALEGLELLLELTLTGHPSYQDTRAQTDELLKKILEESLYILRQEDETTSLEELGGLRAVRRLSNLITRSQELPEQLRPVLKKTPTQKALAEFLGEGY